MTEKKKLSAMQVAERAYAKSSADCVTVVGWCCSFYKKALEKRLLNLGLEIREFIDYNDELHVVDCFGANQSVLLLGGLSEFSPQLITSKLFHSAAKIPACANVVFAGHESLHETIGSLLTNVVCCPSPFFGDYEIVNFEFENHIVRASTTELNVALNSKKLSRAFFDYPDFLIGAVVVAEHSGTCSLLTTGWSGNGQWKIQSVIGLDVFIEKFRDVYSSDLKLIKMIAKFEFESFHEIMTTSLSSRPPGRETEIIYLAFITSLLAKKIETSETHDKISIAFAGSIAQNCSREDKENIIEIVFDSDSLVQLNTEINSRDLLQKMER